MTVLVRGEQGGGRLHLGNLRASPARTFMWVALALAMLALPFLSSPGRYVFDTHDSVWFHPATYLARALALWRPSPSLGYEQHDGMIFPMGVAIWLLRSLHASAWVAERLWHGMLLFAAAGSTILLVDELRKRRTVMAPLVSGLTYALTPYAFGYGLTFTPVFLPYVLLPLLLLVTLRGIGKPGLLWPALFGLTAFAMGGGNGAPQIYVLLTAGALMMWVAAVDKRVSLGAAARFALWSFVFFVGLNAYWLFLFSSPEVANALKFAEQASTINVSSSPAEALRGLGFWQLYGGDRSGPWIPTARSYVTSPLLVLSGYAVPVGAFLSAWLLRLRFRLFLVLLAGAGVFVSAGVFPVRAPTPFGHLLTLAYDHLRGAAGLRTTYKFTAEVNLAFAVLAGIGVEALWAHLDLTRSYRCRRVGLVTLTSLVLALNAYPLWTGGLYNPAHGAPPVPAYWRQALAVLDGRDHAYRAFFAPATGWTTYRWGSLKEGVAATDPMISAVSPLRLPVAQRYGSNLVAALEQPYFDGLPARGSAQLFRYLGVRDVVLQDDLDWVRSRTVRPARLQVLLEDPQIRQLDSFGRRGENVVGEFRRGLANAMEHTLPPVQILTVANPSPIIHSQGGAPIVLSGDGFGVAEAARSGLLTGDPPVLFSGTLSPAGLQRILAEGRPSFILTDSNRRRVWSFSAPNAPHSYTLAPRQTLAGRPVGYLLFNDRADTQSVAEYPGLQSISASSYGSLFGTSPQFRPANAFDGDPSTWWLVGNGSDPTGSWIQATLRQPALLSTISVAQAGAAQLRTIQRVRVEFSDGSSVTRRLLPSGPTTITFPTTRVSWVRVRILSVGPSPRFGQQTEAGIADIGIPGVSPAEVIQVPSDLFDVASKTTRGVASLAGLPFTYVFERSRTDAPGQADEEVRIARRFQVAGDSAFGLSGFVHLNRTATDDKIDRTVFGPKRVWVTSSSRSLGDPSVRGSAAFDGNEATAWVPRHAYGEWLSIHFPAREIGQVVVDSGVGPGRSAIFRLTATFSDGSAATGTLTDPKTGELVMTFPPRITSSVTLRVDEAFSLGSPAPKPVEIKEVHILGVPPLRVHDDAPLPCSVLASGLWIDGKAVLVRPVGTIGQFLRGEELPLATCNPAPFILGAGWHELIAGSGFQADSVMLQTSGVGQSPLGTSRPSVSSSSRWSGAYNVAVREAIEPFYLSIGQNYDSRWKASIDGQDLGPPLLLDGYSAGWRISRTGSFTVSVRFAPQRPYALALLLSGCTLAFALGLVAARIVRR